jgi:hypothetical protein
MSVLVAVRAVFPGATLIRRRTPDDFARFWSELTRQADRCRRAEALAALTLERWGQPQALVQTPPQPANRAAT